MQGFIAPMSRSYLTEFVGPDTLIDLDELLKQIF